MDPKVTHILDLLREARRYTRSNPDEAVRLARSAAHEIEGLAVLPVAFRTRLACNLGEAGNYIWVAPTVFAGYVDGAAIEIQDWAAKTEKGGEGDE